jgi:hypothetical protein
LTTRIERWDSSGKSRRAGTDPTALCLLHV